jgi:hypothetical protein
MYQNSFSSEIRVVTDSRNRDICRTVLNQWNILPLQSQYTFSLLLYVVKNKELCKSNCDIHSINTSHSTDWRPSITKLTTYQREPITLELKLLIVFHLALRLYLSVLNLCIPLCWQINKSRLKTQKPNFIKIKIIS